MKRLTRILVTLMLACTLIPATPVFAGGEYYKGFSWDEIQRFFRGGGNINWALSCTRPAEYTISVVSSVDITVKDGLELSGFYNELPDSLFAINSDNVTFSSVHKMTFKAGQDNYIFATANGAITYVKANNVTIDGFNVLYGRTKGKYAGAIYVEGDNCTIKNCIFNNCDSSYCGGAIYVYGDGCKIKDCTFNNCSSEYGGAIYLEGYGADITGCTFNGCHASNDGGAIYADDDAEIKGCHFTDNTANDCGGSIISGNGPGRVLVKGCDFKGGSCGDVGIWVDCWNDAEIEECTPGDSSKYYKPAKIDSSSNVSSILSEGNIWIIGGVAVVAIAAIVLIVLKRRKKTA